MRKRYRMVTSMTGYGKGSAKISGGELTVEIRTVNHRYIDFSFRQPRILNDFEREMEKIIRRRIKRGHVYVSTQFNSTFEAENLQINKKYLKKIYRDLSAFARKERIPGEVDINALVALPEVLYSATEAIPGKRLKAALLKALQAALENCAGMRTSEGKALLEDIRSRMAKIGKISARIEKKAPRAVETALAKTKNRLQQLIGSAEIDEGRWALEAAIMVDRTDFSEELVRLKSHLEQLGKTLEGGGEVSKKGTFLLQEIHREATTMGNKAADSMIINDCLSIKESVEKIREQIQNLE
ncbi:MAG: YicC family protein [Candidatus Krumholzibacteriota bacterium]|nr:YicC family protein [Candidatus Krumholzibacteriota bacterium]